MDLRDYRTLLLAAAGRHALSRAEWAENWLALLTRIGAAVLGVLLVVQPNLPPLIDRIPDGWTRVLAVALLAWLALSALLRGAHELHQKQEIAKADSDALAAELRDEIDRIREPVIHLEVGHLLIEPRWIARVHGRPPAGPPTSYAVAASLRVTNTSDSRASLQVRILIHLEGGKETSLAISEFQDFGMPEPRQAATINVEPKFSRLVTLRHSIRPAPGEDWKDGYVGRLEVYDRLRPKLPGVVVKMPGDAKV